MKITTLAVLPWITFVTISLQWVSLVNGQVEYPELAVPFLQTASPVTPLPQGFPWGTKTANNTDPYNDPPITGVIRSYDFTIRRENKAPDGFLKPMLTINGQFPAPLIEANWGDTIQVTVHNNITGPEEGVALHWHGLLQKTSQWMDGIPGISQCPIPPGGSFTYSFLADLYGTSWYHSHYSAQYSAGLIGPLVIHGPNTVGYDIDKGPIILSDNYHDSYIDLEAKVVSNATNPFIPSSDSNLINGKNAGSSTGVANFRFTPGKVHRLRLINAGAEGIQKFSLDGHNMTVIANDFVPIVPYTTQVVTLGVGQRTDVLITGLNNATGAYNMRSSISDKCSTSSHPDVTAIVYYTHGALLAGTPNTAPWPAFTNAAACVNDDLNLTQPWFPIEPDLFPPTTENINITFGKNSTGFNLWFMDGISFRTDFNAPTLLLANQGNDSYPLDPQWNIHNYGSNSSIRIILENNGPPIPHPIHLHGHNMFVLDVGTTSSWDGTIIRPNNPQRRDVQLLPGGGYMVLQITADNPGLWPLHCHIAWHASAGFFVTVMERPADIKNLIIPSIMAQTCRDWSAFTNTTILDQIDSGL